MLGQTPADNPCLVDIRIFDYPRRLMDDPAAAVDGSTTAIVQEGISRKKNVGIGGVGKESKYLSIGSPFGDHASDTARVIELAYNTAPLERSLPESILSHVTIVIPGTDPGIRGCHRHITIDHAPRHRDRAGCRDHPAGRP
ncbi:MAG: hypothetical protein QMD46_07855 [Methanomicrobiales archaeon]|nr:hypothetical protein [Methanomicrobiales archaeon]MDI6877104.1 hypothetical protein [Methanomicrobiales archaeon]